MSYIIKDSRATFIDLMLEPKDYKMVGTTGEYFELNGLKFYYYLPNPLNINNLNDYNGFPGTECLDTLKRIEMRGNTLKDGFRVAESWQNVPYGFQGRLLSDEEIRILGLEKYYSN